MSNSLALPRLVDHRSLLPERIYRSVDWRHLEEAKDVKPLMAEMIQWIEITQAEELPCPLRAAIAHYGNA